MKAAAEWMQGVAGTKAEHSHACRALGAAGQSDVERGTRHLSRRTPRLSDLVYGAGGDSGGEGLRMGIPSYVVGNPHRHVEMSRRP